MSISPPLIQDLRVHSHFHLFHIWTPLKWEAWFPACANATISLWAAFTMQLPTWTLSFPYLDSDILCWTTALGRHPLLHSGSLTGMSCCSHPSPWPCPHPWAYHALPPLSLIALEIFKKKARGEMEGRRKREENGKNLSIFSALIIA